MRSVVAIAVLALAVTGVATAAPKPLSATYAVSRDGKVIGEATVRLVDAGQSSWVLTTETHGTSGMAKMLGLDVREESHLRWKDGKWESVTYDYRQDATLKHKTRHIDFDWASAQAKVSDNNKPYGYAIGAGSVDRHAVALAIGDALSGGAKEANFAVAVKDHIEQQQYRVAGEEDVRLPAGNFHVQRIERIDAPNKIRSWYATDKSVMPVRVEQAQGDDSMIVMELKSLQ